MFQMLRQQRELESQQRHFHQQNNHAFQGSIGQQFPPVYQPSGGQQYAHMNPTVFDFDKAVRSSIPKAEVIPENMLARMYNTVDQLPEEFFITPLPDPTFMARHPTWNESSEMDRAPWQDQGNMRYMR